MRYLKRGIGGNRRGRGRSRSKRLHEEEDPLSGVANLFDVAMLFGLGLLVMVLIQMGMQEALTKPEKMKQIIEFNDAGERKLRLHQYLNKVKSWEKGRLKEVLRRRKTQK